MKKLFLSCCAIFLFIIALFSPSCSPAGNEPEKQLNGFDVFSSRDALLSLSPEEQKRAWILRLKAYSELDLSSAQKLILNDLIFDLSALGKGEFFLSEKTKQDAIALGKITPREDFINLFCVETIKSELPELLKTGSICEECISDIERYVRPSSNIPVSYRSAPDCNCNWTCNQQASDRLCLNGQVSTVLSPCSGQTETNCCKETGGCGFLGFGTCNGKVACADKEDE